jgi:hypothetical protein
MKKYTNEQTHVAVGRIKKQNGFTASDLVISKELCRTDGYGMVYGDEEGNLPEYGLKFIDRKLLSMKKIIMDDVKGQTFRSSGNEEADSIVRSVNNFGWKLNELPISVTYDEKTKEYRILEGRTRLSLFQYQFHVNGNMIVDVYVQTDPTKNPGDFSFFLNTIQSPKGVATKYDAKAYLKSQIQTGTLVYNTNIDEVSARKKLYDDVNEMLVRIGMTMTAGDKGKFITEVLQDSGLGGTVKSFNGGRSEVKQYAESQLGLKDTKSHVYLFVSTDEWGAPLKEAVKLRTEMKAKNDNRKIRIVTFKAQLDPKNPVTDWYLANLRVGRKMELRAQQALDAYCPGITLTDSTIEFYGTIPQCTALENSYPMKKVVQYKKVTDKEYNLYGDSK